MSNYYISKCCGEQVQIGPKPNQFVCLQCHADCEVTAMLDTPGGVPKEEAHETLPNFCCACEYDLIELNRRLEVQKAELLSKIKGVGLEEGVDLVTIAKIINKLK